MEFEYEEIGLYLLSNLVLHAHQHYIPAKDLYTSINIRESSVYGSISYTINNISYSIPLEKAIRIREDVTVTSDETNFYFEVADTGKGYDRACKREDGFGITTKSHYS